jgi:hypothetical protein
MRLKAEDLEQLLDHLFPDDTTTPLNLANLSRLYGASTLARALKLKVAISWICSSSRALIPSRGRF